MKYQVVCIIYIKVSKESAHPLPHTHLSPLDFLYVKCLCGLQAHPKPDPKGMRVMEGLEFVLCDFAVELIRAWRTERYPLCPK